jgi:hypothetical protein
VAFGSAYGWLWWVLGGLTPMPLGVVLGAAFAARVEIHPSCA